MEGRHIPKVLVSNRRHSTFKLDPTKVVVQNNLGYQLLISYDCTDTRMNLKDSISEPVIQN